MSNTCQHQHLHDVHNDNHHDVDMRLAEAKARCEAHGVRFTPLREAVYMLILKSGKPLGAYDLIHALQDERKDDKNSSHKNVAPPTIYRSLEFLLNEGLIHQLTSINAYVPCCHPRMAHTVAFLICNNCQKVQECSSPPIDEILSFAKNDAGFKVNQSIIEIRGWCRECQ